jgi:SulP family sulfate permease
VAFAFFSYFRFIPMPVIAAVLISVALKMVDWKHMWHLFNHSKANLALMFLVAGLSIYEDPVIGIAVGTGISLFLLVDKISQGHFHIALNDKKKGLLTSDSDEYGDTLVYSIRGQLVHVNAHQHLTRFESNFSKYNTIILRLKELCLVDFDGLQCLEDIISMLHGRNQKVILVGLSNQLEDALYNVPALANIKDQGLVFAKTTHALKYLGYKASQLQSR